MNSQPDYCDVQVVDGITLVTFLEEPNLSMSKTILQYLHDSNLYHFRCFDFNGLKWHMTHDEIIELAKFSKQLFVDENYTCFTTDDDLSYGTLRELSVYREQEGLNEVGVFRTIEESIDWLQGKRISLLSTED